jgi:tRNA A37 threonylcarbamoyladenosine modification protein TsaB
VTFLLLERKKKKLDDRRIKIKSNLPKPTSCFLKVSSCGSGYHIKLGRARSNNTQEKDNNSPKAIDNLSLKLKQKKQEVQQLEINPNDILEEEEKR